MLVDCGILSPALAFSEAYSQIRGVQLLFSSLDLDLIFALMFSKLSGKMSQEVCLHRYSIEHISLY